MNDEILDSLMMYFRDASNAQYDLIMINNRPYPTRDRLPNASSIIREAAECALLCADAAEMYSDLAKSIREEAEKLIPPGVDLSSYVHPDFCIDGEQSHVEGVVL